MAFLNDQYSTRIQGEYRNERGFKQDWSAYMDTVQSYLDRTKFTKITEELQKELSKNN